MRKLPSPLRQASLGLTAAGLTLSALLAPSCADDTDPTGAGGTGTVGAGGAGGASTASGVMPGELCSEPDPSILKMRAGPGTVFVPPCSGASACVRRKVRIALDPDVCSPRPVTFQSGDAAIAPAPAETSFDLHRPEVVIEVGGGSQVGTTQLTVNVMSADGKALEATAPIQVVVLDPKASTCSGAVAKPKLAGGETLHGGDGLAGASIGLPMGADNPNAGSFLWSVAPFAASIACAESLKLPGALPLGPAITFGPADKTFPREVPLSIPVNPALLPAAARLRHLRVAYAGPSFRAPRTIPVTDPRIEQVDGQWALTFKAPRLGTYQAVVASDAGAKTRKRRLTHRAVIGVSMGGGGTATFGMRHHDRFDVLAPLGGPVDWTFMLASIEQNHLGGFRSIKKGTTLPEIQLASTLCLTSAECKPDETCIGYLASGPVQGKCVLMPKVREPYAHPATFNTWWYEYPRSGNGGTFARAEYAQIFRDLALMYGNPNGENLSPGGENLPAGVPPDDPSQVGDHPNGECKVWVDPTSGPDHDRQAEIAASCPKERCSHPLTLQNYFDDEYNPDGVFPVISICDGNAQNEALTPYANTWHPEGNDYPLEVGLAVDYNGNGVRDELEPVIRAGHEPFADDGEDGLSSPKEPGYAAGDNDDPAGDDYDPQYNPRGTEGDHRFEPGEAWSDVGLDGVAGTKAQPPGGYQKPGDGYDVGEGDGKFTVARGLQRFWDRDAHSIVARMVDPAKVPSGELTDEALARIDLWTDGGTRDLFNFGAAAQHLVGTFAGRGRDTAYFDAFTAVPGLDPRSPGDYYPARVVYEDLPGVVFQRYGKVDPTPEDIASGSGQHVGSGTEILSRIQSALYFIGSRWQDPELHWQFESSADDPIPGAPECEVLGSCTLEFTSKAGRAGPFAVTLPPGYANRKLEHVRYPVIYMLHGYGQSPEDLAAAAVLVRSWMNSPQDSGASRLTKAILVYVDGRCRIGAGGKPECLQGTFFADSPRADGAEDEQWWLELMDYVDQRYRTLGEREVDWAD